MNLFGRFGDWLYFFKLGFLSAHIRQDQFFVRLLLGSIFLAGINFLLVGIFFPRLPEIMIFHSNIYFGPDLSGEWYYVFIVPLLGLAIIFAHYLLGTLLYPKRATLALMLVAGGAVINIFLLVATGLILKLNI